MPRTRSADPSSPGIARRRRGRGFQFLGVDGKPVDAATLDRIRALAIPPAWSDVWICPDPLGHLQAVGTDGAGRRQYLYHELWRRRRDQEKFERMERFARSLPTLRARVADHLSRPDLGRERVLAASVRLLDLGFFRVSMEAYADDNGTFGLATVLRRHVCVARGSMEFDYPGKGRKRHTQIVRDREVVPIIRALKERRGGGKELLAFTANGRWRDVRSSDINDYMKEATGPEFSAKDFRTWNATVLAAVALAGANATPASKTARRRMEVIAVKETAGYLGNTPAVCRGSYIDPRVFDRFRAGVTIRASVDRLGAEDLWASPRARRRIEAAVLAVLEGRGTEARRAA